MAKKRAAPEEPPVDPVDPVGSVDPMDVDDPDDARPVESQTHARLPTTLYRLRCFEVVVEEGGFKRAISRLHITQPALSYQIKQLEKELGVQLFFRRPGGVNPTDAGRLLYLHAQQVSAAAARASRAIKDLSETASGEVRIGTVSSVGTYFLPQLLRNARERHPAMRPTVLYREADDVVATLLLDQLDLAILAEPRIDRRLHYETLFHEPVSLVSSPGHPFFGRATVAPEQLEHTRVVGLSPQTPTGNIISCYLERLGVSVEPVVFSDSVETLKRMVEIGMGVAMLPDMVTEREVNGPDRRLNRSTIGPPLHRRIVLVTWKQPPVSHAVSAFIDLARRSGDAWRISPEARPGG